MNAARLEAILSGKGSGEADGAGRAAVLLNAGAAILVAGLAGSMADAIERARVALEGGEARAALERLRRASVSTSE